MNRTILIWVFYFLICPVFAQSNLNNLALNRAAWSSTNNDFVHTAHLATDGDTLHTFWESQARDTTKVEWIFVDLGKVFEISEIVIRWGIYYGRQYSIQTSKANHNPKVWSELLMEKEGNGKVDALAFSPVKARFVRVLILHKSAKFNATKIRSLEVYGEGQRVQTGVKPTSGFDKNQRFLLDGNWKIQNEAQVYPSAVEIASNGVNTNGWLNATVPGTVLSTYLDNGAVPDPNYGDWQSQVSEYFTNSTYWYRTEIELPPDFKNKKVWLHFNGINYLADVYFNGKLVKTIERCFLRHQLDISDLVHFDKKNVLAVRIHPVKHPGKVTVQTYNDIGRNGGKLGADNPTFHFSVGWDWNPTVRGRNIGIWDEVFLRASGDVIVQDPYVISTLPLPDTSRAELRIKALVKNQSLKTVEGLVKAKINGILVAEKKIQLPGRSEQEIDLSPDQFPKLKIQHPSLWWPNGYGQPTLQDLELSFWENDSVSDTHASRFGIRTIDYDYGPDQNLQIVVNGQKILCRGGNWGANDINIRFDKKKYERQVRFHREMNFNMIRNWVGQTGHECFYDYCDQYGILVWDDFWLANSWDGPNPADNRLFMQNVRDKILKLRHHPSVALWCGRNETKAPNKLEKAMKEAVAELDGQRLFIKNSRAYPARPSSGPWHLETSPNWYFNQKKGFLTELGLPCVPPVESLHRMLPETDRWPINDMWGLHDFGRGAARAQTYSQAICDRYGDPESLEDFCQKAQLVNWVNYKALFEAWGQIVGDDNAGGVLLWMSQSTWPSLVWQTYDYFFEATGAYFGSKLACEPIHIQWDASNTQAFAINTTQHKLKDLKAEVWVYNLNGSVAFYEMADNLSVTPFNKTHCLSFPLAQDTTLSEVHFVKMRLSKNEETISENFYWRSQDGQNYRALAQLPMVQPSIDIDAIKGAGFSVRVKNETNQVALAIRLKLIDPATGLTVLPLVYSDNYFSLTPNSEKTIRIDLEPDMELPEGTKLVVEGWNIQTFEIRLLDFKY